MAATNSISTWSSCWGRAIGTSTPGSRCTATARWAWCRVPTRAATGWIRSSGFGARGDVGGFGLGSDFAWDATAFFDWRFGKNFSMAFGYRYFDLQFDDRGGADAFDLDMQQGGPAIGVAYTF